MFLGDEYPLNFIFDNCIDEPKDGQIIGTLKAIPNSLSDFQYEDALLVWDQGAVVSISKVHYEEKYAPQ